MPAKELDMKFDARTIELVQTTWAEVEGDSIPFAQDFYDNMFEMYPQLPKTLFKMTDMNMQVKNGLPTGIGRAVHMLNKPDELLPSIKSLGFRHTGYGTEEVHYGYAKKAFFKTMSSKLSDGKWTPELEAAWEAVYTRLQQIMIDAQNTPAGKKKYQDWQAVFGPVIYGTDYNTDLSKKVDKNTSSSSNMTMMLAVGALVVASVAYYLKNKK